MNNHIYGPAETIETIGIPEFPEVPINKTTTSPQISHQQAASRTSSRTTMTTITTIVPHNENKKHATLKALLGPKLLCCSSTGTLDTNIALAEKKYLALYFSASYCTLCVNFTPSLIAAYEKLSTQLEVVLVSNDRTEESFDAYRQKMPWLAIPYSSLQSGTKESLREKYVVTTIPRLVLLDMETGELLLSDARSKMQDDPQGAGFPWTDDVVTDVEAGVVVAVPAMPEGDLTGWDRAFSKPLFALGHSLPGKQGVYMDENVVRCRAGILNSISWIAMANVLVYHNARLLFALYPIVALDFLASGTIGLTPLAPIGGLATLLVHLAGSPPYWKPAAPKRFAWFLGFILVNGCFTAFMLNNRLIIFCAILTCNALTWLEASVGFCLGCFIFNKLIAPSMKLEECQECKM